MLLNKKLFFLVLQSIKNAIPGAKPREFIYLFLVCLNS